MPFSNFTGRIEVRPNAKEITDAQMKDESEESAKNGGKWRKKII